MELQLIFGATFVCLVAAALALALGLAWGRPLLGGGCRTRLVAGGLLPGCRACPAPGTEAVVEGPGERTEGAGNAQRA